MTYYRNSMDAPLTPWFIIQEAYRQGESASAAYQQVVAAGFTDVNQATVAEQYEEWLEQDLAISEQNFDDAGYDDYNDYDVEGML